MRFLKELINKIDIKNIIFFSLLIRFLFLIFFDLPNFGDTQTHKQIGEEIFSGNIIFSSIHMPGYGIYMHISNLLMKSNFGVIFFDIILSCSTVYIIYQISKKIFNDINIAKISAIIYSIYPFSIFFSLSSLNENLYIFLLFSSIWFFYNNKYLYGVIFIIISIYVKSISFFIAPILILSFLFFSKNYSSKNLLKYISIYIITLTFLMTPWWIHNFKKYDTFIPTNLSYGYHLYSGNNEMNKTGGGIGGKDVSHKLILDSLEHDYFKADKVFKEHAYNYIKNNPMEFVGITFTKLLRFWSFYPADEKYSNFFYKFTSIFSYGPIFFLSLIFIFFYSRNYIREIIPLITTLFLFTAIYSLTIVSIRYRFPIEPILIILSSYNLKKILFSLK